ncbi:MAG: hypothetical protein C0594_07675 [Marinilabiliales bacterium]|nr:MAG: hypothetical protein C0594_07675 [Marinilabiliales bacterium]
MKKILCFLLLIGFISCTDNSVYIKETVKLKESVDSINQVLNTYDLDSIRSMYDNLNGTIEKLKKLDAGLPEDDSLLLYLNKFGFVVKGTRKFIQKNESYRKDVKYCTEQVSNLEQDIKNNIYNASEIESYINDEKKAIDKLSQKTAALSNIKDDISFYKNYYHIVIEYVDSLEQSIKK